MYYFTEISKAIQDAIRDGLVQLDAQLVDMRDKMEEAKLSEEEGVNRKSGESPALLVRYTKVITNFHLISQF
jgi:hypothetical protein